MGPDGHLALGSHTTMYGSQVRCVNTKIKEQDDSIEVLP